jgi:hypothetical protein
LPQLLPCFGGILFSEVIIVIKCFHCGKGEIERYYLSGVYLVPDEDKETALTGAPMYMRLGARFRPTAMLLCPICGISTFLEPAVATAAGLRPVSYEEAVREKPLTDKERIRIAQQMLKDLGAMAERAESE